MLTKYEMENASSIGTSVDLSSKCVCASDEDELFDSCLYQSAVESLLCPSTGTRPNIAFAVGMVAKFSSKLTKQQIMFRYLKGMTEFELLYRKETRSQLSGFSDVDWAGDLDDRKSTSG